MNTFEDVLLPDPLPPGTEFWRATVVATSPLRVERVQGVMPATPENFAGPLAVGDRVFGLTLNTRPVVIGRAATSPTVFTGSEIFESLESGVTVDSDSTALVEGRKALMTLSLGGVERTSGNQRTEVGVLREELVPVHAFGFDAYYTNGSAQFAVTSTGAMSIRWASSSGSNSLYASTAWVLAGGQ